VCGLQWYSLALVLVLFANRIEAQQLPQLPTFETGVQDQGPQGKDPKKADPKNPDLKQPDLKQPDLKQPDVKPPLPQPQTYPSLLDSLGVSSAQPGGSDSVSAYNPHMMGDIFGIFERMTQSVSSQQTTTSTFTPVRGVSGPPGATTTTTNTFQQTRTVLVPVTTLGAFNIAENESPRPQDRVFAFYNFFGDLRGPDTGSSNPVVTSQTTTVTSVLGSTTTTTTTTTPGVPRPVLNLSREIIGFEKTFFDGRASVEVRVPLLQMQGDTYSGNYFGDLTLIGKYAFLLDNATGNVISGGLALTLPTGPGLDTEEGTFRSTLIQPWVGYIWNFSNFYIQGFSSVVVPTDAQNVTIMFNDLGINYWLYRGSPDRFLSMVVPTLEAHVTTPLNHRSPSDALSVPDIVVLTGGVHFGVYRNTTLTVGAAAPVTGPVPFSAEGFVQLNWRF
jgi:hypothetical protein